MGKKYILLIVMGLLAINVRATHIVGGEFELVHLQDFDYRLSLVQYFDVVNGNPQAEDSSVLVFIFRKFDNQFMRSITLDKVERTLVEYTQPQCAIGQLVTRRLVYSQDLELPPDIFDHPEGYYVVFERCCRNNVISNIFLASPNTVGQTFYLEFPPVVIGQDRFINSSPTLFRPLSDFACVDELYFFDFSGIDPDEDSIVYSMANPLNSSAVIALPTPSPAPHPVVPWNPGISIDNQIPGQPELTTTPDGFLTVRPERSGLFAFALKAEEFRDGIKIGEVRRDFQMLVIDCPGPNFPPQFLVRKKGQAFHDPSQILQFAEDEEKCFDLLVTDFNSHDLGGGEVVNIDLFPINFEADISSILSDSVGLLDLINDTLTIEVCLPDCPYLEDEPFKIEFRASDNTCPLPLMDTVELSIVVETPQNTDPFFTQPVAGIVDTLREGESIGFTLAGLDNDFDTLSLTLAGNNFDVSDFGMELLIVNQAPGQIEGEFLWNTGCGVNNFGLFDDFELLFILDDLDACGEGNADTVSVSLHVILPPNTDPVVTLVQGNGGVEEQDIEIEIDLDQSIDFQVQVVDSDLDSVGLRAEGVGFDLQDLFMEFQSARGLSQASSNFSWDVICGQLGLAKGTDFQVNFIGTDQDTCKIPNADTLSVTFRVRVPDNSPPVLSILQADSTTNQLAAGKELKLDLVGVDADNDPLRLQLISYEGELPPERFSFEDATGIGSVSSPFRIKPECFDLAIDSMMTLRFVFVLIDNYCINNQTDTVELVLNLSDPTPDYETFIPPNVFTPNGDGVNDVFFIPNLPADNCMAQMESVEIYDRWGGLAFSDTTREFVWDGFGAAAGVYYYFIRYTNDVEYKGVLSVRR